MAADQRRLIIVLSAVLLAVLAVSAAVLLLLPDNDEIATDNTPSTPAAPVSGEVELPDGTVFNLAVLQRAVYKNLNLGVLQGGLLPVRPPAAVGKANPFL